MSGPAFTITKSVLLKDETYAMVIYIEGNGIKDYLTVSVPVGINMRSLFIPNGFLLGDFRHDESSMFTDKSGTLVTIRGEQKRCSLRSYEEGRVHARLMGNNECNGVKKAIVRWWKKNKTMEDDVFDKNFKGLAVVKKEHGHSTGCQSDVVVVGDDVQGRISWPCETARRVVLVRTARGFVLGDYRTDRASLVSWEGKLYTVTGGRTVRCARMTAETTNNVRTKPVDEAECDAVRRTAEERLRGVEINPAEEFKFTQNTRMNFGVCYMDLAVRGNGLDERVSTTCADGALMRRVLLANGFILGDYARNDKCLFTDTAGSLTVVTREKCYRRSRIGGKKQLIILSSTSCALTKEKIRNVLGKEPSKHLYYTVYRHRNYEGQDCSEDVVVKSRGIDDMLTIDCRKEVGVKTIFAGRRFLLGDYREHSTSAYADTPDSLVVIRGRERTCSRGAFSGGEYKSVALDEVACRAVKAAAERVIDNSQNEFNETSQYVKNLEFLFVRRKHEYNNECKDVLTIHGNGISHIIQVSCVLGSNLDLLYIPNGFIFGDYRTGMTVFTDSPRTLVLIKGAAKRCTRYVYLEGQQPKPVSMVEADCGAIRQFVADQWDNKESRGLRYTGRNTG